MAPSLLASSPEYELHTDKRQGSGPGAANADELGELLSYHTSDRTVTDEGGLNCADPSDEATCPKARKCIHSDHCHTDQPNWSDDGILQQPYPFGWGPNTPKYLNPTVDHKWRILPPKGYTWHLETTSWAIMPRDPNDLETLGR